MMGSRSFCFAALLGLAVPQYSCHKPTPEEGYAQAKHCYATLDALLKIVPPAGFREARLDRSGVRTAADDFLSSAWDLGKSMGMKVNAIAMDVERARATYLQSHSRSARRRPNDLRDDSEACLNDYFGTPYD